MTLRRTIGTVLGTVVSCLLLSGSALADARALSSALESITSRDLKRHANLLASDTLEGREAGTRGGHAAGAYLITELKKLGVRPAGESSYYQSFGSGYRNVLASLPGSDSALRKEYIVVGAHYDHVGYGTRRNSYGPVGYIHNGADDNASGTAGLLELIEGLTVVEPAPKRSILFAFWDAEEKGLLGSEHWMENPTVPLDRVKLAVNLDMIGRLRENTLEVYGVRTGAGLRKLVSDQNAVSDLRLKFNLENGRDSDHYSFFSRRIPYLMFHTRKHENYHRPSDDVDKLNLSGMRRISRLLFRTVHAASNSRRLPPFRRAVLREDASDGRGSTSAAGRSPAIAKSRAAGNAVRGITAASPAAGVRRPRLGVSWDAEAAGRGVIQLTRVASGSPAERAGLEVGDRVLRFAGRTAEEMDSFAAAVRAAANPATIVVQRRGRPEPLELTVRLRGKRERLGISWREDDAEPGVVILTRVTAGSAADRAGLMPEHRIYAVSGREFESSAEFRRLVTMLESPLRLLVETRGQLREVELDVPPPADGETRGKPRRTEDRR